MKIVDKLIKNDALEGLSIAKFVQSNSCTFNIPYVDDYFFFFFGFYFRLFVDWLQKCTFPPISVLPNLVTSDTFLQEFFLILLDCVVGET